MLNSFSSKDPNSSTSAVFNIIVFVLLLIVFLLLLGICIWILMPFLHAILIGMLLAFCTYPINKYIINRYKLNPTVSTILTTIITLTIILIPTLTIGSSVVNQVSSLASDIGEHAKDIKSSGFWNKHLLKLVDEETLNKWFSDENIEKAGSHIQSFLSDAVSIAGNKALSIISVIGNFFFQFCIMLMVMFYALKDGMKWRQNVIELSPLTESESNMIIDRVAKNARTSLLTTIVTMSAQGIAAMIGFWICGIPGVFLGTMVAISTIIPVVGSLIIYVPVMIWFWATGSPGSAFFLLAWVTVMSNGIDYILRPILMSGKDNLQPFFLVLAILGGVIKFGILGFLYGPVIFSLTNLFFWIYKQRQNVFVEQPEEI